MAETVEHMLTPRRDYPVGACFLPPYLVIRFDAEDPLYHRIVPTPDRYFCYLTGIGQNPHVAPCSSCASESNLEWLL